MKFIYHYKFIIFNLIKKYFEKVGIAKDKNLLIEKEKENDFKFDF